MARNKFQRTFTLFVQINDAIIESEIDFLEIKDPFTVQFSINRNIMSSLNTMQMQVFNLSRRQRSQIFKDRFSKKYRRIIFKAGYGQQSVCFQGDIFSAFSERRGSDIVTMIECRDGGFSNQTDQISKTFNKDISKEEILNELIGTMKTLTKGVISPDDEVKKRATVLDGGSVYLINKETNGFFIDLEKVNILKDNEVIKGAVPLINTKTGLLGTPKRQDSYITVDTIFEPQVKVGQAVQIESGVQPEFTGQYKVIGVQHTGVISQGMSGSCKSTFSLLLPDQITGGFVEI